jgi:hypothetical protein
VVPVDTGVLDASRFVANNTGFTDNNQRFWYDTDTHILSYDSNGSDTGGTSIQLVELVNGFALDPAHIWMV